MLSVILTVCDIQRCCDVEEGLSDERAKELTAEHQGKVDACVTNCRALMPSAFVTDSMLQELSTRARLLTPYLDDSKVNERDLVAQLQWHVQDMARQRLPASAGGVSAATQPPNSASSDIDNANDDVHDIDFDPPSPSAANNEEEDANDEKEDEEEEEEAEDDEDKAEEAEKGSGVRTKDGRTNRERKKAQGFKPQAQIEQPLTPDESSDWYICVVYVVWYLLNMRLPEHVQDCAVYHRVRGYQNVGRT